MEQLKEVMRQMIQVSDQELSEFLDRVVPKKFKRLEIITQPDVIPEEVFFITKGLIRVFIVDQNGVEHTVHFALENQFISDYAHFILNQPSIYWLQAMEETEVISLPRSAIEWGYTHLREGQKMGRLVAEFYFIYHDDRIKNTYLRTPKQRYDSITEVFPNIHNRVPQHLIASYLGITPIHLSRLKKEDYRKV